MRTLNLIIRLLFAFIYLVFGLNGLFNLFEMPAVPEKAGAFIGALYASGYLLQIVKVMEILTALFLLFNRFVPLALVVIFPISLNVFLFGLFLNPSGIPIGIFMLASNIYLMLVNYSAYKGMLKS